MLCYVMLWAASRSSVGCSLHQCRCGCTSPAVVPGRCNTVLAYVCAGGWQAAPLQGSFFVHYVTMLLPIK
jgi:hypothetical protein